LYSFTPDKYENRFTHRVIDTAAIARFLTISGLINIDNASLGKTCEAFGITIDGQHTARGDVEATAKLLTKMVEMVKGVVA
jgi:DNA polymerase III alpha subunit (gram-positive type)